MVCCRYKYIQISAKNLEDTNDVNCTIRKKMYTGAWEKLVGWTDTASLLFSRPHFYTGREIFFSQYRKPE